MSTLDALQALAEDLAITDGYLKEASDARKEIEAELRAKHELIYEREQHWKEERAKLETEARGLIDQYREETGETGNICEGWYQITAPLKLALIDGCEMHHLVSFILTSAPVLKDHLTVDLRTLDKALGGKVPDVLADIPVQYTPQYGSKIMWSKLPQPETS